MTSLADVTDRTASQAACAEAASVLGAIDILVHNAGTADSAPFMRSGPALFQRMIDVHLLAVVHTTQAVLPGMLERGYGHVVNVASIAGLTGAPYFTAYVAAKHAMVGLTRALALEAGPQGVAVNAVCPGFVDTDLVTDAARRIAAKTGRTEAEAVRSILDNAGQPRVVTAEEVAVAVIALCTAAAGSVLGQAVVLDGTQPA
jgi:NAD(P)-dependent dehydrogenase (short-subunit alcohol dehydrogenase family)